MGRPRHEEKRDAVLAILTHKPQSVRAIARAAGVPRSTTQDILEELEFDGALKTEDGWVSQKASDTSTKNSPDGRSPDTSESGFGFVEPNPGSALEVRCPSGEFSVENSDTPPDSSGNDHRDDRQGLLDDLRELGL